MGIYRISNINLEEKNLTNQWKTMIINLHYSLTQKTRKDKGKHARTTKTRLDNIRFEQVHISNRKIQNNNNEQEATKIIAR